MNEIAILDPTNDPAQYIKVNISIFKPEILLAKIAEKTANGHFVNTERSSLEDPNRKQELVNFYHYYGYEDLLKDYFPESNKKV